jgi:[acyl-carrier-protein] S-malonyltransferase
VATLAVILAAAKVAISFGLQPTAAAGHSLGEFGALTLAGVLTEEEAMTLVAKRSALMEETSSQTPGAMSAILELSPQDVESLCELARNEGQVVAANFNSPLQTVISGEPRAVSAAVRFSELKGGKAVPLPVSGAFHSPLMKPAALAFSQILDSVEFKTPKFPVVPNALGQPVTDPNHLKELLKDQMTSPVRFTSTISSLIEMGVDDFLECWPKAYLGPMVRKNIKNTDLKITIQPAGKLAKS